MSNPDLELLNARISEGQEALRALHAQKRQAIAAQRRAEIETGSKQARSQGLELASVSQPGAPSPAPHAGFPTSKTSVDMSRAQPALVNTALTDVDQVEVQAPPPPVQQGGLSERDTRFLQGAISESRGPQMVTLFPRTKTV